MSHRLERFLYWMRILSFAGGAIGVIEEAIRHAGNVPNSQLAMAGFAAAMAYAAKWPSDVTAADHKELVATAVRQTIPPDYDPKQEGITNGP